MSENGKHTPGPWVVILPDDISDFDADCGCQFRLSDDGDWAITQCHVHKAAPELLAALQEAKAFLYDGALDTEITVYKRTVRNQISDAIRKATTGQ